MAAGAVTVLITPRRGPWANEPFEPRPSDIASVFFIAKSQNRNQVHYGVRVDRDCRPLGSRPVFAYWRMLESRGEIEPVLDYELPAYGLGDVQELEPTGVDETTVRVSLRALPERPLVFTVKGSVASCRASATTTIAGIESHLLFVYVRLQWPFGIDYLLLRGIRGETGRTVEEILRR